MSDDELFQQHDSATPPTTEAKGVVQSLRENDDIITNEVSTDATKSAGPDLHAQQRLAKVPPDNLGLFPADSEEPILFSGPDKVVLGRASLPQTSTVLDLTPFNAIDLGVSRRHAAITISGSQYLIEDLGSMNGTWLHETRLPIFVQRTLTSGDVVRLGQLEIAVYFHARTEPVQAPSVRIEAPLKVSRAAPDPTLLLFAGAEEMILTVDKQAVQIDERMTVDFIAVYLNPFLQMLEQLQRLLDEMQGKARRSLVVLQIRAGQGISVTVSGASDAISVGRTQILKWRQKHASDVQKLISARARQASPQLSHEQMVAMEVSEAELTAEILTKFGSKLPPAELATYARQLIEPVKALVYSPLYIEPGESN